MTAVVETTTTRGGISKSMKNNIVREHEHAIISLSEGVWHAVRCGRLLIEAKAQTDHGAWLPWLDENFPASRRTAQGYMKLAARSGDDASAYAQALAHLGVAGALKAMAAPKTLPDASDHPVAEPADDDVHGDVHGDDGEQLHAGELHAGEDARPPESDWHRRRGARARSRISGWLNSLQVFAEGEAGHEHLLAQLGLALEHATAEDRANWLEQCDGTMAVLERVRSEVQGEAGRRS